MKIQILINKNSWAQDYKKLIKFKLKKFTKKIIFLNDHKKLKNRYDINIIFSYFKIIEKKYLNKSKFNIIPHESDLPKGQGMSPLTWQILKGKNNITFSLIEASHKIDDGPIYYKRRKIIKADVVFNEIKNIQFETNIALIKKFLNFYKKKGKTPNKSIPKGKKTYFRTRTPKDSKLNINKSLKSQFNLLRLCDTKNYPAFFYLNKKKYFLKLEKKK